MLAGVLADLTTITANATVGSREYGDGFIYKHRRYVGKMGKHLFTLVNQYDLLGRAFDLTSAKGRL